MGISRLTNAKLVPLGFRVIALENLMIAVMAEGSERLRHSDLGVAPYTRPRTARM